MKSLALTLTCFLWSLLSFSAFSLSLLIKSLCLLSLRGACLSLTSPIRLALTRGGLPTHAVSQRLTIVSCFSRERRPYLAGVEEG